MGVSFGIDDFLVYTHILCLPGSVDFVRDRLLVKRPFFLGVRR